MSHLTDWTDAAVHNLGTISDTELADRLEAFAWGRLPLRTVESALIAEAIDRLRTYIPEHGAYGEWRRQRIQPLKRSTC